jgi:hypothetical protein
MFAVPVPLVSIGGTDSAPLSGTLNDTEAAFAAPVNTSPAAKTNARATRRDISKSISSS